MKSSQRKTVLLRMYFSDRDLAKPGLLDLGQDRALWVNVLRGRITRDDASFEPRIMGQLQRIKEFLRLSNTWGASVGTSSMGVA